MLLRPRPRPLGSSRWGCAVLAGGSLGGGILEQAGSFSMRLLLRSFYPLGNHFCMPPRAAGGTWS